MATDNARLVKFVAKLNRMTQEGKIKWESKRTPHDLIAGTDHKVPLFFGTLVEGKHVGLYILRSQWYDPERDKLYWNEKMVLAFCEADWTPIWEFPPIAGIGALLESVQRQFTGVDGFIDHFLAEDDE